MSDYDDSDPDYYSDDNEYDNIIIACSVCSRPRPKRYFRKTVKIISQEWDDDKDELVTTELKLGVIVCKGCINKFDDVMKTDDLEIIYKK